MPGPGVNQSVNIPINQMNSLDYTENKSKASISGSKRGSGRSGSRGTSAVSRGSKSRKLQTVVVDNDADIVNFSTNNIQITDPTIQMQGLTLHNDQNSDDFQPIPPGQSFNPKKFMGPKHRGGAETQSIDRTSQHMKITQNLAKHLEAQLEQDLDGFNQKENDY